MKGSLLKKSQDGIWSKRFCETDGVFLTIYKNKTADKIIQIICLPQASNIKLTEIVQTDEDLGVQFDIIMPDGKAVNFKAQSYKEATDWVNCLHDMIQMPMPTSLPTTPSENETSKIDDKENQVENSSTSKKRVTFVLQTDSVKKPSRGSSLTVGNVQAKEKEMQYTSNPMKVKREKPKVQHLLTRVDLSSKFYFKRDKQMILSNILSLYPPSPASSHGSPPLHVPFTNIPYTSILKKDTDRVITKSIKPKLSEPATAVVAPSQKSQRHKIWYLITVLTIVLLAGLILFITKNSLVGLKSRANDESAQGRKIKITPVYSQSTFPASSVNENVANLLETILDASADSTDDGSHNSFEFEESKEQENHPAFTNENFSGENVLIEIKYRDSKLAQKFQPKPTLSVSKAALAAIQLPFKLMGFVFSILYNSLNKMVGVILR